jgi:hypothetical protein
MRIAYTSAQKREAVALARVAGIEAAAESLGIDPRTVRKWSAQAGDRPELDGNAAAWQRAFDLAHAKVEGFLASGKASAVTAATIMGIAQRNLRDLERQQAKTPQPDEPTSVEQAIDEFEAIVGEAYPETDLSEIISILLAHDRLTEADDGPRPSEDGQDVIESWLATLAGLVEEHGSLEAAHEWQRAEEHRRLEEQLERNRINSERAIASSR